ncbi:MAG TPA: hypothetical protein V6C85_19085 [Allocoleopsis sp.]
MPFSLRVLCTDISGANTTYADITTSSAERSLLGELRQLAALTERPIILAH